MAKIKFRTPEQVFRKWLKALRSGKYDQVQGQLREAEYDYDDDDYDAEPKLTNVVGFCCLGVLCDIAAKDGGRQWGERGMNDDDETPPEVILDYLGLDSDMTSHLIEMNDDQGASFEEIADEIEFNIMPALGLK